MSIVLIEIVPVFIIILREFRTKIYKYSTWNINVFFSSCNYFLCTTQIIFQTKVFISLYQFPTCACSVTNHMCSYHSVHWTVKIFKSETVLSTPPFELQAVSKYIWCIRTKIVRWVHWQLWSSHYYVLEQFIRFILD